LKNAGGATKEVADKNLQSFSKQLKITWNHVEIAASKIGKVLAPYIAMLGDKIRQLTNWFESLPEGFIKFAAVIGVVLAALGPLLLVIGAIGGALAAASIILAKLIVLLGALGTVAAAVFSPIGALVAAIVVAVGVLANVVVQAFGGWAALLEKIKVGLMVAWDAFKKFTMGAIGFFTHFKENMAILADWFSNSWASLLIDAGRMVYAILKSVVKNAINIIKTVPTVIGVLVGWMDDKIREYAPRIVQGIIDAFGKMFQWIQDKAIRAGANLLKWMAGGGKQALIDTNIFANYVKGEGQTGTLGERLKGAGVFEGWSTGLGEFARMGGMRTKMPELKLTWGDKLARRIDEATKGKGKQGDTGVPGGLPSGMPGAEGGMSKAGSTAGALLRGTSAAIEAAYKGRNIDESIERNTRAQLSESKQQTRLMKDVANGIEDMSFEEVTI
jgi:hypothetical protein